jgi:hypothetical protein
MHKRGRDTKQLGARSRRNKLPSRSKGETTDRVSIMVKKEELFFFGNRRLLQETTNFGIDNKDKCGRAATTRSD